MIRAVFFDFDGVLGAAARGSTTTIQGIHAAAPDIPLGRIRDCYYRHHPDLISGAATHASIWGEFGACVGREIDPRALEAAFAAVALDPEVMAIARRLARRARVGILTDNAADRMDAIAARHDLASLFDPIVVSARHGGSKSGPGIFVRALELAGCRAREAAFIDNQARNLLVPRAMGIQTYLFDPAAGGARGLGHWLGELGLGPVAEGPGGGK